MKNIAYSIKYQNVRAQLICAVFIPGNLLETERIEIGSGLYAKRGRYCCTFDGFNHSASETNIYNAGGDRVYRYLNINDDAEFLTLIHHSNGRQYLLFRIDLYGYGIYDIAAGKDFFYIPDEAETFIWVDPFYNSANDILAVEGCYWACPGDIIILDFEKPMAETRWFCLRDKLDAGYEKYDDIDFVRWDKTSLIVSTIETTILDRREIYAAKELRIEESGYREWMR